MLKSNTPLLHATNHTNHNTRRLNLYLNKRITNFTSIAPVLNPLSRLDPSITLVQ